MSTPPTASNPEPVTGDEEGTSPRPTTDAEGGPPSSTTAKADGGTTSPPTTNDDRKTPSPPTTDHDPMTPSPPTSNDDRQTTSPPTTDHDRQTTSPSTTNHDGQTPSSLAINDNRGKPSQSITKRDGEAASPPTTNDDRQTPSPPTTNHDGQTPSPPTSDRRGKPSPPSRNQEGESADRPRPRGPGRGRRRHGRAPSPPTSEDGRKPSPPIAGSERASRPQPAATSPHPRRWAILGVLCLALLVVVIDNTVLNVAIPSLIRDLHAGSADIQWILDAYIVVFAGLLLTAGGLSDRYGRRAGLVVGLILFGGASVPATLSGSSGELIAARALMGAGAAFLMPGTLSILTAVFDDDERKKAIAIWSSVLMLGALGGPLVGGVLLDHFWWGSVFLLNVPIAALGVVAALLIIPETRGPSGRPDLLGALLSTVGMTALVWGVISSAKDGWSSAQTVGGFVVGWWPWRRSRSGSASARRPCCRWPCSATACSPARACRSSFCPSAPAA
jgi:MFS transporter